MSRGPLMMTKTLAERMGIRSIDAPDGTRLEVQTFEIETKNREPVRVTVHYLMFGPDPKPANTEQAGGYVVPPELEDAVRTGLDIVQQPRTLATLGPKLSAWIDGSVAPTIAGVYERDLSPTCRVIPAYSLWDGTSWRAAHHDVREAHLESARSSCQNAPWRGLRDDPALSKGPAS